MHARLRAHARRFSKDFQVQSIRDISHSNTLEERETRKLQFIRKPASTKTIFFMCESLQNVILLDRHGFHRPEVEIGETPRTRTLGHRELGPGRRPGNARDANTKSSYGS